MRLDAIVPNHFFIPLSYHTTVVELSVPTIDVVDKFIQSTWIADMAITWDLKNLIALLRGLKIPNISGGS